MGEPQRPQDLSNRESKTNLLDLEVSSTKLYAEKNSPIGQKRNKASVPLATARSAKSKILPKIQFIETTSKILPIDKHTTQAAPSKWHPQDAKSLQRSKKHSHHRTNCPQASKSHGSPKPPATTSTSLNYLPRNRFSSSFRRDFGRRSG